MMLVEKPDEGWLLAHPLIEVSGAAGSISFLTNVATKF